jgi:hypothetical protein
MIEMVEKQTNYEGIPKSSSQYNIETMKRIKAELLRHSKKTKTQLTTKMENLINGYINVHHQVLGEERMLVYLCYPFAMVFEKEFEAYWCFERLINMVEELDDQNDLVMNIKGKPKRTVSNFIMLFRNLIPELYNHFEDEEVEFEWCNSWIYGLLSKELPISLLLRLWDAYFSMPEGLSLHMYICLAILLQCKENLEDMEQSEIKSLLSRLPELDIDQVSSFNFFIQNIFII